MDRKLVFPLQRLIHLHWILMKVLQDDFVVMYVLLWICNSKISVPGPPIRSATLDLHSYQQRSSIFLCIVNHVNCFQLPLVLFFKLKHPEIYFTLCPDSFLFSSPSFSLLPLSLYFALLFFLFFLFFFFVFLSL